MDPTQERITHILKLLGIEASVRTETVLGQRSFQIESPDGALLVGRGGEVVQSLNYLLKKMAEHEGGEANFFVDINGFKKKQIDELEQHAKMLAERARALKYDVEMPPMTAYERLVVHTTLQSESHIKTESIGEGHERRLVIKYVGER